jgi:ABC-type multidrug transport system ATPase subunit
VVAVSGLNVSLGGKAILRDLDLVLETGSVLGVTGPNGSGKTTLARTLATLVPPRSGSGTVLGASLGTDEVYRVRTKIGMIGHTPFPIPDLSLRENLTHFVRLRGLARDAIEASLRAVGIADAADRRASAASFGMLRRVEVAYLLIIRPRLLVLDEAIAGLDADARGLIDALTERTRDDDGSVLVISHDREHLSNTCDRVMSLGSGRLEVGG